MRISELWRTTTFRLTVLYGLAFVLGAVALLSMVYVQSDRYLTRRVDFILGTEADALAQAPPRELDRRIGEALALNGERTNIFAVFSATGQRLAGNLTALPPALRPGEPPIEAAPPHGFPGHVRVIARRLPSGAELVVGRDVSQLLELRSITTSVLGWSAVCIVLAGLACGAGLSLAPLRRLRQLQAAATAIAGGELKRRMPVSHRQDELDMFAGTVNYMMDEVERLMAEVKASTETIAHDLRTPLTRARTQLHRLQQGQAHRPDDIGRIIAEIDAVLERFRALLRISELEGRERQAGFRSVDLAEIARQVVELYHPLAEAEGVKLAGADSPVGAVVEADPKLLFEAVSNLVDNAIKFTGRGFRTGGGEVRVRLDGQPDAPRIIVQDNGPGIPAGERSAVLQRFYRGERDRLIPGSGLGLSIVAAIVRLHRFELALQDAEPGLRVVIDCRPAVIAR